MYAFFTVSYLTYVYDSVPLNRLLNPPGDHVLTRLARDKPHNSNAPSHQTPPFSLQSSGLAL